MIQIKNMRNEKPSKPWDVRVDRSSVLGNPYPMRTEAERDKVCDLYEQWLEFKLKGDTQQSKEINRLAQLYLQYGKLNLFCWCAPKRCHGETVRVAILAEVEDIQRYTEETV